MANILLMPGPNSGYKLKGVSPAGFADGLWHGIISPITFIISVFNSNVMIYETKNNGFAYECGFLLGIVATLGTSTSQIV